MPATSTRERIVATTTELFRRHGYTGTGLKQIVADANAPFGSIYHFFPGGKEQLGVEVIRRAGQMYMEIVLATLSDAPDPVSAMTHGFTAAATVLRETDWLDPCPVATVAAEVASSNEALRLATAEVFESWIEVGTASFAAYGIAPERARDLAVVFTELLEAGFLLSRAMRSTEPLEIAGRTMAGLVAAALPAQGPAAAG